MIKVSTASIILTIYISTLQGSAGSDDYEIVLPRVVTGQNLTWAMLGPRYTVDKPVMLDTRTKGIQCAGRQGAGTHLSR